MVNSKNDLELHYEGDTAIMLIIKVAERTLCGKCMYLSYRLVLEL